MPEFDLAVLDTTVLPGDGSAPLTRTTVAVRDGVVAALLPGTQPVEAARTIDGSGSAVLPGFVDSHTHIASNLLLRGLNEDAELFAWLATMWRLKKNFDHETLYWASLCGLVEMAKAGITCFNEHFDAYAVTPQVRALTQVPLKATLGYGLADIGLYDQVGPWAWRALHDWDAAAAGARSVPGGVDDDRVRLALSPHALYSCTPEMWKAVRALADERGLTIHTHLAEGLNEVAYVRDTYDRTPVEHLAELGLLGPDLTAAHCTQLTAHDIALLAEHEVKVSHCPISNAKLVSGTMNLRDVLAAGVTVGLATDGPASHNTLDMFQELKFAAITHKQLTGDPTFLTARQALQLAGQGSGQVMHRPELGVVRVGAPADLVVVNLQTSHTAPVYDAEATVVYASRADDVTHTIVDGRLLVDDGVVLGIDEAEVVARFREAAHALVARSL